MTQNLLYKLDKALKQNTNSNEIEVMCRDYLTKFPNNPRVLSVLNKLKKEKNYLIAFDTAYKKVLTTILDSNVTTLIAAFVLYYMGSGPVKGFAITLGIGILSTFFTTYVLGRLLVAKYIKNNKETTIVI